MVTIYRMSRTLVFVCQHGAAKSVIAAAWAQRLATEMGLSVRAMARATEPSAELLPAAVDGLRREGLDAAEPKPRALSSEEASGAWRVISFGPDVSTLSPTSVPVERWTVPDVSAGYESSRDAIVEQVRRLLTTLIA